MTKILGITSSLRCFEASCPYFREVAGFHARPKKLLKRKFHPAKTLAADGNNPAGHGKIMLAAHCA
jgi:hypothetical protein